MQMKKKALTRNSSKDLGSSMASKYQRKVPEDERVQEKKVSDMITSSARKHRSGGAYLKKIRDDVDPTNLNTKYALEDDGFSNELSENGISDAVNNIYVDAKGCNGTTPCETGTIFSPTFHSPRVGGGEIPCRDVECGLSSPVSALYDSMKNSKLECIDEYDQSHVSSDVQMEDEEFEEFDEFNPYYFMKNLPELSSVVPTFRPLLLPKQTRSCPPTTLVLDLDETLVHSSLEPCDDVDFTFTVNFNLQDHTVYVRCRPHLHDFMERVSGLFEIIIFTASQSIYAEQLLNVLDPKRKVFRHRVYRESCVLVEGNYLKDLSVLGRDLAHVVMIDNSPQAFGFQVDNGIPIESWFDDRSDKELISLLPFLESLVGVEDVRPLIARRFNLRKKIAAAVCPFICNVGNPFQR